MLNLAFASSVAGVAAVDVLLPPALVPHSSLQLPPGPPPPPQAMALLEQLLRRQHSPASAILAIQVLRGGVPTVTGPQEQEAEEQQQQQEGRQQRRRRQRQQQRQQRRQQQAPDSPSQLEGGGPDAAKGLVAELQRVSYCSLASSLVQVVANNEQVGACCAELLLSMAADLAQAACKESSAVASAGNGSGAAGSSSGVANNSSSSAARNSSSSSSSRHGRWSLAASLAAAAAVGGYTAHKKRCEQQVGAELEGDDSNRRAITSGTHTANTCSIADAAGHGDGHTGGTPCLKECSMCCSASQLLITLRSLEQGAAVPTLLEHAGVAALVGVAQQRSANPQQYLQQQLLALALRHSAPGVCGNVVCERLEGPAAVCGVRGERRSLCGGCGAAWYTNTGIAARSARTQPGGHTGMHAVGLFGAPEFTQEGGGGVATQLQACCSCSWACRAAVLASSCCACASSSASAAVGMSSGDPSFKQKVSARRGVELQGPKLWLGSSALRWLPAVQDLAARMQHCKPLRDASTSLLVINAEMQWLQRRFAGHVAPASVVTTISTDIATGNASPERPGTSLSSALQVNHHNIKATLTPGFASGSRSACQLEPCQLAGRTAVLNAQLPVALFPASLHMPCESTAPISCSVAADIVLCCSCHTPVTGL
jgi:hypothetical protein